MNKHFRIKLDLLKGFKNRGQVAKAVLMACLLELGQLSAVEIDKLPGVAPLNRDSGKMRGKPTTREPRADVRCALYMATLSAVRYNLAIRTCYTQPRAAGKCPKSHWWLVCINFSR